MRSKRGLVVRPKLLGRPNVWHRLRYGTVIAIIALGLYAAFLWMLPQPNTWVALKTTAEVLHFQAIKHDLAAFHVSGMSAVSLDDKNNLDGCIDAILTPAKNARVEYRRGDDEFFRIIIDPKEPGGVSLALWEKGVARSITGSVVLTAKRDCGGGTPKRLPIWGPAEFGEEVRPAGPSGEIVPGMLLNGTIEVYAIAHQRLIGLSFPASVYSVMTFDLPPGFVLRSAASSSDEKAEDEATWTGTAIVSSGKTGFDVEATSNTPSVTLKSSRTFGRTDTTSRQIDLGHYAQFIKDPNVLWI